MAEGESTVTEPSCRACEGRWPHREHFITDLGLSKAYLHDDQYFPGWTVIVFKRHATELFHLAQTERIQLMEEVTVAAKALAETFGARKINYELLGNQLPHIHWHVVPRLAEDPAPLEPVWRVPHEPTRLTGADLQDRLRSIAEAIARLRQATRQLR